MKVSFALLVGAHQASRSTRARKFYGPCMLAATTIAYGTDVRLGLLQPLRPTHLHHQRHSYILIGWGLAARRTQVGRPKRTQHIPTLLEADADTQRRVVQRANEND